MQPELWVTRAERCERRHGHTRTEQERQRDRQIAAYRPLREADALARGTQALDRSGARWPNCSVSSAITVRFVRIIPCDERGLLAGDQTGIDHDVAAHGVEVTRI